MRADLTGFCLERRCASDRRKAMSAATTPAPIPLLVSSRNAHKTREIGGILGPRFAVSDIDALEGFPDVEETGATFEENATLKALAASQHFAGWVIADDSGLEVDALDGSPGVWSARFAGTGATDGENNSLLLEKLDAITGSARSARFRCVIVVARSGRKMAAFEGTVEGVIAAGPSGHSGFGYDPLFIPDGFSKSFAEMGHDEKNRISHRRRALEQLASWGGFF